ncbi:hypothetical protein Nepgr_020146 [Nepenthes gracilis]|uniref:Uncharacterized protein n=1 Tax=Nepenthes gracilis TaxID=150966 RepID=A0AAD3SUV8_NEPGR|nr:hypothetical protein Nepgr_020146 [Nepenthes gracilis]
MKIRGQAEREVREETAREGGVDVHREGARDMPPEEADRDCGDETESKSEDWNRHSYNRKTITKQSRNGRYERR